MSKQNPLSIIFYGWVIVALSFIIFAIGFSITSSFSLFYMAILRDFDWSRANTAIAFSLHTFLLGINGWFLGTLLDRFGPRVIMSIGTIILAISLFLSNKINALWHLYLLYGLLISLGVSAIGWVPITVILSHWFQKKRATAMGIAIAGVGIGQLVLIPLMAIYYIKIGLAFSFCRTWGHGISIHLSFCNHFF